MTLPSHSNLESLIGKSVALLFFLLGLGILYFSDTHKIFECSQKTKVCKLYTERLIGPNSEEVFPIVAIRDVFTHATALEQGYSYEVYISTRRDIHFATKIAEFPNDSSKADTTKEQLLAFLQIPGSPDIRIEEPSTLLYRVTGLAILFFSILLFLVPRKLKA